MIRRGIAKVRASAIAEALVINDRDSSSDMQLTTTHIINCLTPEILSFLAGFKLVPGPINVKSIKVWTIDAQIQNLMQIVTTLE